MTALSANIPTLTTERLRLRAHRIEDFEAYAGFMTSERAHFMGGPLDRRAAWASFCRDVAQWALLGHGGLAVELSDRGENALLAGQVGLNHHPYFDDKELGWLLFDGFEGRGIAAEAAETLRDWAHHAFPGAPIVSYIHADNAASIRLAERLGAVRDESASCPYANHIVYRHPSPEELT